MSKDDPCHEQSAQVDCSVSAEGPLQSDRLREAVDLIEICHGRLILVENEREWISNQDIIDELCGFLLQQSTSAGLKSDEVATPSAPPLPSDHDTNKQLQEAREIIADCQQRLASYLPPGSGISPQQCISDLLEILDGPRARSFLNRTA